MNPLDFIYINIQKQLITDGYSVDIASLSASARYGVDEYKRRSQSSKRGHIYEDCLLEARRKAKSYNLTQE